MMSVTGNKISKQIQVLKRPFRDCTNIYNMPLGSRSFKSKKCQFVSKSDKNTNYKSQHKELRICLEKCVLRDVIVEENLCTTKCTNAKVKSNSVKGICINSTPFERKAKVMHNESCSSKKISEHLICTSPNDVMNQEHHGLKPEKKMRYKNDPKECIIKELSVNLNTSIISKDQGGFNDCDDVYIDPSNKDSIEQDKYKNTNETSESSFEKNIVVSPITELKSQAELKVVLKRINLNSHTNIKRKDVQLPENHVNLTNNKHSNRILGDNGKKSELAVHIVNPKAIDSHVKTNVGNIMQYNKGRNITETSSKSNEVQSSRKDLDSDSVVTPLIKRLRKCEKKNYLEISDESTNDENTNHVNEKKIPVYKQIFPVKESKKQKDPYELDISDSELNKLKTKKINRKMQSDKFDKTMHDIIKKLEKNEKKQLKRRKLVKYQKNINSVLQKVMNKIEQKTKKIETGETTNDLHKVQINNPNSGIDSLKNRKIVPNISLVSEVSEHIVSDNNYEEFPNSVNFPASPPNLTHDVGSELSDSSYYDTSDDELSSLTGNNIPICQHKNSTINVISNVLLNSPKKPPAQSTKATCSPWRVNVTRSTNYVVTYKSNSLPCLKQDAVINYNLTGRIEESFQNELLKNKTTQQTPQKTLTQASITDFVNTSHNQISSAPTADVENIPGNIFYPSLYGYEEFEVSQSPRVSNKRKVLGVISQNNINSNCIMSTPIRRHNIQMPSPNISVIANATQVEDQQTPHNSENTVDINNSYFGFISTGSDGKEQQDDHNSAKPLRISMGVIRNYKNNAKKKQVTVDVTEDLPSVLMINENPNADEGGRIFDDVEPELLGDLDEPLHYVKRGKRRQRLESVNSDCSDERKAKRKKKNAMTKAEEEELEKWVTEFNALCEEIDKHELEIE